MFIEMLTNKCVNDFIDPHTSTEVGYGVSGAVYAAGRDNQHYVVKKSRGFGAQLPRDYAGEALAIEMWHHLNLVDEGIYIQGMVVLADGVALTRIKGFTPAVSHYRWANTYPTPGPAVAALDSLINNGDRHGRNWGYDKSDTPWLIDHGECYVLSEANLGLGARCLAAVRPDANGCYKETPEEKLIRWGSPQYQFFLNLGWEMKTIDAVTQWNSEPCKKLITYPPAGDPINEIYRRYEQREMLCI
jgi:hypothetical protein